MDNKVIIGAGIGLGVLLLLMGSRSAPRTSDAASVATASLNASAAQAATAPALLAGLTELQQVQLAAGNAHRQSTYDFLTNIDLNNIKRTEDFLAIGAHAMDLSANDKINKRTVKAQTTIALKQLDTQEDIARMQNKSNTALGFMDKIFSGGGLLSATGGGVGGGAGSGGGSDLIAQLMKVLGGI
jgi:hypothetical protein